MKAIIVALLLAVMASGCAQKGIVGGPIRTVPMLQVGVRVHVVNNCVPSLDLEHRGRVEIANIPYGGSAIVPLSSEPFTGSARRMFLTAKGYTLKGEYLGSRTRQFSVNTRQGTEDAVWEVNDLNLPGSRGGCIR